MADDLLSEDELGALLDSIDDDAVHANAERRIVDYDFARPDKLNPEQIRALQRLYETVAQEVETAMGRMLRLNVQVNLVSLGQLSFEVFRNSLYSPLVLQVLDMDPGSEHALLTMDLKMAFSLVDRMLGGEGKAIEDARPLTGIEEGLVENITDRFLERSAEGWRRFAPFEFTVVERESDPQFVQVIPAAEMVLVATFGVQAPGEIEAGEVCLCIPFLNIEEFIGRIGSQNRFATVHRAATKAQKEHVQRVVGDTTTPFIAEVGKATLTIGEILELAQDDVLVLDQRKGALLEASVGGLRKVYGYAGQIGNKMGLLVEQVQPEGHRPGSAGLEQARQGKEA